MIHKTLKKAIQFERQILPVTTLNHLEGNYISIFFFLQMSSFAEITEEKANAVFWFYNK